MSTVELLQAARDRLVRDGWTRRTLADPEGRHCAIGAVMNTKLLRCNDGLIEFDRDIHGLTEEENTAIKFLASVTPELGYSMRDFQEHILRVTNYNDSWESINPVLEMFDGAILAAKEREA